MAQSEAARTFNVSLSSLKRYVRPSRQGRSLLPGAKASGKRPKIDESARKLLEVDLKPGRQHVVVMDNLGAHKPRRVKGS